MMNVYIKSVIYLTVFGGVGYVLSEVTKPSKEKIDKIRQSQSYAESDDKSRKALFMKKLKEAGESSEPIYLKKRKED
ncbi:uncharacterized protein LOC129775856 [Toxorhynchites rutilus septentrionalis]|uniref:uncharacterized protein LOC129775856 n=1 Tax=Toxorhynchites rutilus septentrionalis TaxID=329112 RepID=UPI002478D3D5|nr:uncharacterized protein LOC129775856 [Toxorhynchites rutilus septentrionalis]